MSDTATAGHLSIGEVLAMVQQDFPDVTISKIRFLESQGLIAPERTGSGYRKFYEADIERLRWILHQQRDNFLPLKVIKNMLEQGVDQYDPMGDQPTLWSTTTDLDLLDPSTVQGDEDDEDEDDPSLSDEAAAGAERMSPAHPAVASATQRSEDSTSAQRSRALLPEARNAQRDADLATETTSTSGEPVTESNRPAHTTPADVVAALQEDPRIKGRSRKGSAASDGDGSSSAQSEPSEAARSGRGKPARKKKSSASDTLLSAEELCELCSISEDLLAGLEQYGLVVPGFMGGRPTYDGEAVEVAHFAARYAELGVEPRHLRMYKVSAEREAGFVEQLVVPLMKQRNPASRQQAAERCDELLAMGAELHAALLQRQLSQITRSDQD
ncbi:MerR family regulatory protein [Actinobacteria bacterium IMCC26207]|nr:MerR family regulatory protein [Actinobacteria bacterium IMCC26207]